MQIVINLHDMSVAGVNTPVMPGQAVIFTPDAAVLYKEIIEPITLYQEQPPLRIVEQKVDESGRLLYVNAEGNVTTMDQERIMVEVQRKYEAIYGTGTDPETGEPIQIMTGYSCPVIENGEITGFTTVAEPGNYTVQVETVRTNQPLYLRDELQEQPPLEIEGETLRFVSIRDEPAAFTVTDVVKAKFEHLVHARGAQNCYYDEFITEADIDLGAEGHAANTGVKVLELLPYGQCQTVPLLLDETSQEFELYIESDAAIQVEISSDGVEFVVFDNNYAILKEPAAAIVLRFKETAGKAGRINAYALCYGGGGEL